MSAKAKGTMGAESIPALLEIIREREAEIERLTQISGELCPVCGWATMIPDECVNCASHRRLDLLRRVLWLEHGNGCPEDVMRDVKKEVEG